MSITREGLFKYQALSERQRKNLLILDVIRKEGPVSKASLTKELGYNIVTLSNYIEEYLKKGLVYEKGTDVSSGGRRPVLLELNKSGFFIIGIDFGKEILSGVVTDLALNIISEARLPRPEVEQEAIKNTLIQLIKELIKSSKVDAGKVKFISIGLYGTIVGKNAAIKGLDEEKGKSRATVYFTELKTAIEKEFNITTFFGQDASFAAFGEKFKNPSADVHNMLYMFQDIGKGVVIKGEIFCSTELGGIGLEGITGSLSEEEDRRISEESLYLMPWNQQMSLRNEARRVIESGVGTRIVELLKGNLEGMDEEIIMKAAWEKDDIAVGLIEGVAINLGVRIAYLVNLFSPQVVIIGGGIEKAGEILFNQIEKTIDKLSLERPGHAVKLFPGILGERCVAMGAACVALREVFLEA